MPKPPPFKCLITGISIKEYNFAFTLQQTKRITKEVNLIYNGKNLEEAFIEYIKKCEIKIFVIASEISETVLRNIARFKIIYTKDTIKEIEKRDIESDKKKPLN